MAVLAPPPLVPEQASAETLRAAGPEVAAVSYREYRVQVFGADVLSADAIAAAMQPAQSLSDAVLALAQAYRDAGYPAALLQYARVDQTLFVHVQLHDLSAVRAPEPLEAYFDDLPGPGPLKTGALERRRALASLHADRAGLEAQGKLEKQPQGYVLDFKPHSGPDPTSLALEFGNPGNRFSGRYFLDLDIRHARPSGDEFTVTWARGLTGLDNGNGTDSFNEENLGWSRVTPLGLFALRGRYVAYSQNLQGSDGAADPTAYNGSTRELELGWSYPLLADFQSRSTLAAQLDYTQKEFGEALSDVEVQSQEYASAQLGAFHTRRLFWRGRELFADAGMVLRKGLNESRVSDPLVAADLGYFLVRPELHLEWSVRRAWKLSLDALGQLTADSLPEEEQWVLGGLENGEAYIPGVAVGDSGALARLMLGRDPENPGRFGFKPAVYLEYGYADMEIAQGGFPAGRQSLTDIGFEVGAQVYSWLSAKVSMAHSLAESGVDAARLDESEADFFFSLKASFGQK